MKQYLIYALLLLAAACGKDETPEPRPNIPPLEAEMLPGGWPEPVVPNLNGAAAHFNTYIDFNSYWNSAAMNQFQRAGYKFVRMGLRGTTWKRSMVFIVSEVIQVTSPVTTWLSMLFSGAASVPYSAWASGTHFTGNRRLSPSPLRRG